MKYSSLLVTIISLLVLDCCSNINKEYPRNIAPPPQINKNHPNSLQRFKSQNSNYQPSSKVDEIRDNGGGFSEIKINNRGNLPSYYLYPNQQIEQNINNQQRTISTPTWQLNW